MEGLDPGIDYQSSVAAPVPATGFGTDAVYVYCRVGAGEGYPEKVIQGRCRETTVAADHDQRKTVKSVPFAVEKAEAFKENPNTKKVITLFRHRICITK